MSSQIPQRKVLLLTNSEYGQANTFLALTHALAVEPNVHVHFASFHDGAPRVNQLRDDLQRSGKLGIGSAITFHDIGGPSMKDVSPAFQDGQYVHAPGFFGAIASYRMVPKTIVNWSPAQYMEGINGIIRIIKDVDPHAIAIDNILQQGYDACDKLGRKYLAAGPYALKDITLMVQPNFIMNYPAHVFIFVFPCSQIRI